MHRVGGRVRRVHRVGVAVRGGGEGGGDAGGGGGGVGASAAWAEARRRRLRRIQGRTVYGPCWGGVTTSGHSEGYL